MVRMGAPIVIVIVAALLVVGACGPVTSTRYLNQAEIAIEQARLEDAEEFATYEYVSALAYYSKAQEEWGYSDYQHAEAYAERALDFARQARQRAQGSMERGTRFDDDLDDE